jgi:oxygen-independent coproporphyrinogen-3 oxidase
MDKETVLDFATAPPLSLYIHIPWCVRKCPYCDFNSFEARDEIPEQDYVSALLRDLDYSAPGLTGREIVSIFIGGGTPSLLSGEAMRQLLDGVRTRLGVRSDAEITMESNPGAVETVYLRDYRAAGVNRLSIGVQSFRDVPLETLGRIHRSDEAIAAYQAARKAGFDNINLDLMYGLPDDDEAGAMSDLDTAIELGPEHLSWYQLTVEPNTAFYRHPPPLPDDDVTWDILQAGQTRLAQHGYARYEVSAYARDGRRCRHNLNYWEFGDYLGIGAGAHSKITTVSHPRVMRFSKQVNPKTYMATAGTREVLVGEHVIGAREMIVEFMMNALRMKQGFPQSLFPSRTGLPMAALEPMLQESVDRGFLVLEGDRIQPTELGYRYLNELIYSFYQD